VSITFEKLQEESSYDKTQKKKKGRGSYVYDLINRAKGEAYDPV